ncbi:hypothetical protein M011DRAFT_252746 [Sporormia fimetaria CBS 119925]|uniref:Uncharacterized protein n=1 Tax=Sporormia fimetaria CBS 119925 TaxID=1340428 RepID=A0A6A6UXD6_9PLEO|nr:hypothetical protein M011DRAFT_252746 [Sporormia fimetaria CBS 119925]
MFTLLLQMDAAVKRGSKYYSLIDSARFLLEFPNGDEQLDDRRFVVVICYTQRELAEWLWDNAPLATRKLCMKSFETHYFPGDWETFLQKIISSWTSSEQQYLTTPEFASFFFGNPRLLGEFASFELGEVLVKALMKLGVDLEWYRACVLGKPELGFLVDTTHCFSGGTVQVQLERNSGARWMMDWRWWFDPDEPGYDLVSEFRILANDADEEEWPYFPLDKWYYDEFFRRKTRHRGRNFVWQERYSRKAEKRLLKRLRTTGQEPPGTQMLCKNQMPGSWRG